MNTINLNNTSNAYGTCPAPTKATPYGTCPAEPIPSQTWGEWIQGMGWWSGQKLAHVGATVFLSNKLIQPAIGYVSQKLQIVANHYFQHDPRKNAIAQISIGAFSTAASFLSSYFLVPHILEWGKNFLGTTIPWALGNAPLLPGFLMTQGNALWEIAKPYLPDSLKIPLTISLLAAPLIKYSLEATYNKIVKSENQFTMMPGQPNLISRKGVKEAFFWIASIALASRLGTVSEIAYDVATSHRVKLFTSEYIVQPLSHFQEKYPQASIICSTYLIGLLTPLFLAGGAGAMSALKQFLFPSVDPSQIKEFKKHQQKLSKVIETLEKDQLKVEEIEREKRASVRKGALLEKSHHLQQQKIKELCRLMTLSPEELSHDAQAQKLFKKSSAAKSTKDQKAEEISKQPKRGRFQYGATPELKLSK